MKWAPRIIFFISLVSLTSSVEATETRQHRLGIDAVVRIPVADWSDATGVAGFGGLLRYEWLTTPQLGVTGRAGYIFGLSTERGGADVSTSEIPLLVGMKYHFQDYGSGKRAGFYLAAELGAVVIKSSESRSGFGERSSTKTRFGLSAGAGYEIIDIDIGARFFAPSLSDLTDFMGVLVTVGYGFFSF